MVKQDLISTLKRAKSFCDQATRKGITCKDSIHELNPTNLKSLEGEMLWANLFNNSRVLDYKKSYSITTKDELQLFRETITYLHEFLEADLIFHEDLEIMQERLNLMACANSFGEKLGDFTKLTPNYIKRTKEGS